MAIVHDNTTTSSGSTNQLQFNHTTSGSNRLLVVAVQLDDDTGASTVTTVKYNNVDLTQAARTASSWDEAQLWYLVNPASGTNQVEVNLDASYNVAAAASSYTGVIQSSPLDDTGTNFGDSATASVSVDTSVANALIVETVASEDGGTNMSPSSGQNERYDFNPHSFLQMGGGDEVEASATTHTRQWTVGNNDWAIVAASFKPLSTYTKANSVKANIEHLTLQTDYWSTTFTQPTITQGNSVKANIDKTITRANLVKANIQRTESYENDTKSNIERTEPKENLVKVNIDKTTFKINSVKAWLEKDFHHPSYVKANIIDTYDHDNDSKAWIEVTVSKENQTVANIEVTEEKTNFSKANIQRTEPKTNLVKADIEKTQTHDNEVVAWITTERSKSSYVKAWIFYEDVSNNNLVKAEIIGWDDWSDGWELNITSENFTKANIEVTESVENQTKANIDRTYTQDNDTKANIERVETYDNEVKAWIEVTETRENDVKANIDRTYTKANAVKATIEREGFSTNEVKANIIRYNETQDNDVKANIERLGETWDNDTKALIEVSESRTNAVKALIVDYEAIIYDQFTGDNNDDVTGRYPDTINIPNSQWEDMAQATAPPGGGLIQDDQLQLTLNNAGQVIESGVSDCIIKFDWTPGVGNLNRNSVVFRYVDNYNMWYFNIREDNGDIQLLSFTGGVATYHVTAQSYPYWAEGQTFEIKVLLEGSTIKCYIDGVEQISLDNSTHIDATKHGVIRNTGSDATRIDDFIILSTHNFRQNLVKADIEVTTSQSQDVLSNIQRTEFYENQAIANIENTYTSDNEVKANIRRTESKDNFVVGNIDRTYVKGNLVKATIEKPGFNFNEVKANIIRFGETQHNQVIANIDRTYTQDNQTKANIETPYSSDNDVKSCIEVINSVPNQVKAWIEVTETRDNLVITNIDRTYLKSNAVKGNIDRHFAYPQTVKANIIRYNETKDNYTKANIIDTYDHINAVKGCIEQTRIYDNDVKAELSGRGYQANMVMAWIHIPRKIYTPRPYDTRERPKYRPRVVYRRLKTRRMP